MLAKSVLERIGSPIELVKTWATLAWMLIKLAKTRQIAIEEFL